MGKHTSTLLNCSEQVDTHKIINTSLYCKDDNPTKTLKLTEKLRKGVKRQGITHKDD